MDMEIGARLKDARESKEMSLEQVQQTTKIQKRYLQAIEKNEFDVLPGKFYTRAFIREYASAVGLDPEQVMEEHQKELPTFEDEGAVQYSRVQKSKKETAAKSSNASKLFPTVLTFVLIIGIAFVIWIFTQNSNGSEPNSSPDQVESNDDISVPGDSENATADGSSEEKSSEEDDAESKEDTTAKEDDESGSEGDEPTESEQPDAVEVNLVQEGTGGFPEHTYEVSGVEDPQLTIELTGGAYLDVKAPKGGESLISPIEYGTGDSPIKVDLKGQNQVHIRTGSANHINVKINGQEVAFPAESPVTQKLLINFK